MTNPPHDPPTGEEDLLTVPEVCARLRVTKDWLYDQVEARQIPHVRLGRHLRFDPAQLRTYLQERSIPREGPQDPAPR